ncbi:hypothetical protein KSC_032660 [Ktedonobacter sp. SOSP1-52]|uniref:3'-5' exonuclease n=1 Tax=Ktedonobacter sp. SOSP1-52 TaxID=2778366 RepID=UPI001915C382|nr:3'-5' exonuclease [Ktedonobacter sp. SOSP1-52]GHO64374.1 hypothetical protein KSC_032660 [Ktedonobacter sp. SOSP1-52]
MPAADRSHVLWRVATIVEAHKWCALDVETTGLGMKDQVIEVGVCGPDLIPHSWRIRPTVPVTPEATAIHGITDADLEQCPTYPEIWPDILTHIAGRKTVMYHADFDYAMLRHSARAFALRPPEIWQGQCVMNWYAVVHGEPRGFADYRSQSLHTACQCLGISLPQGGHLHSAATDALLTAHVMLRLADLHRRASGQKP